METTVPAPRPPGFRLTRRPARIGTRSTWRSSSRWASSIRPTRRSLTSMLTEAAIQLGLARVMLVPARIPPHKPVDEEPGASHRLEMCRLAVRGDEHRFEVSDIEVRRDGPSYTVDTLDELRSSKPDTELFLIV